MGDWKRKRWAEKGRERDACGWSRSYILADALDWVCCFYARLEQMSASLKDFISACRHLQVLATHKLDHFLLLSPPLFLSLALSPPPPPLSLSHTHAGLDVLVCVRLPRVCDPEVGLGLKPRVCASFCSDWLQACADSFFEFDSRSGLLRACAEGAGAGVCARLGSIVQHGDALCKHSKLEVAMPRQRQHGDESDRDESAGVREQDERCFDGSTPPVLPACKQKERATTKRKGGGSRRGRNRQLVDGGVVVWMLVGLASAVAVFVYRRRAVRIVRACLDRLLYWRTPRAAQGRFKGRARFAR